MLRNTRNSSVTAKKYYCGDKDFTGLKGGEENEKEKGGS